MIAKFVFLIFGVFCCSTAVIFIKASTEHAVLLASYRLLVAALILTPLFLRDYKKRRKYALHTYIRVAFFPGVMLGLHFISWIIGARMTTAANASLIVNLVPIVMPFFMFYMIREKLTKAEFLGTASALAGLLLLSREDFNLSPTYFWGDMLCLVSMLFFSFYLALGRKNRRVESIWLYIVPLYYIAGIFCFVISLFFLSPIKPYSPQDIMLILALGVVPTVIGHSLLNYSMKHLRGQIVSIVNMWQFIFAGIMAFFLLRERPEKMFYIASLLIVIGAWLAVNSSKEVEKHED